MCAAAATAGRAERAGGRPLWVFVWLRLSSSLGKWKFNTPLQRSGYQVREQERETQGKKQAVHRCGERNRKGEAGVRRPRGSGELREPQRDNNTLRWLKAELRISFLSYKSTQNGWLKFTEKSNGH